MRVFRQEFLVILGENGVGKSTLLNIIAGIDQNFTGKLDKKTGLKIGMVFQHLSLFPHLTVEQNIAFGLEDLSKTEQESRLSEIYELFRIRSIRDKYPRELSGGERQKVAIARSIAPKPDILLLDEPFAAIDEGFRSNIAFSIKNILKEQSITTILVTHKQEEALALADRIAILDEGEIIQAGTPSDIYDKPQNIKLAKFIGFMNFIHSEINGNQLITPIGKLDYDKDAENIHHCDIQGDRIKTKGNQAIIGIRPENLEISMTGKANATIKEIRYYGHDVDVIAETMHDKRISLTIRLLGSSDFTKLKLKVGKQIDVKLKESSRFVVF